MSRTATRATAALLCGVVLVALGLALAGAPSAAEPAPVSLTVNLDFDPFVAGVAQTRTSDVEVPVPSRVIDASVATAPGRSSAIDVEMRICHTGTCQLLTAGTELEPGPYTLTIEAVLVARTDALGEPTGEAAGEAGRLSGRIRIVETAQSNLTEPATLVAIAAIGLTVVVVGGLALRPRREVMS